MGKLRSAFRLIKWGSTAAASILICTWIVSNTPSTDLQTLTDSFNQQNDPESRTQSSHLRVASNYGELTFYDPAITETALTLMNANEQTGEMPPDMQLAVLYAAQSGTIPLDFFIRMAKIENSKYDVDAVNKSTKACGLFQMTPQTQLQLLFEKGLDFPKPYRQIAAQVENYVKDRDKKKRPIYGFRVKDGISHDTVIDSCKHPVMNTLLAREYITYNAERLAAELPERKLTFTDLYLAHFLDAPAAAKFIRLAENPKTDFHRADDYFKKEAGRNKGMFYKPDGKPRSFAQIYERIERIMGTATITLKNSENPLRMAQVLSTS